MNQFDINNVFTEIFGVTPLTERLTGIQNKAIDLNRFSNTQNLKDNLGDLLAASIQLCNEQGWTPDQLIQNTLDKIHRRKKQYKTLGRRIQVAILGGAFNPPTIGHIKLAQFVLNTSGVFDEVYLMPCYSHMYGKVMASPEHRLEMCRIAAKNDPRIKTFDFEIEHALSGSTYNMAKRLKEFHLNDSHEFSMIIGMDNANTFDKWVDYKDLEKIIRFVVVSRKGIEPQADWFRKGPHIYLESESDIPLTSSTEVRECLANGDGNKRLPDLLDNGVKEYIVRHHLY